MNEAAGGIARTALLAGLIAGLLTTGVALVSTARTIDVGPKVGDILVFRKGARMPTDWEFTVATTATPPITCALRPAAMASGGGSLVVEQRLERRRTFRYTGPAPAPANSRPTAAQPPTSSCPSADLQLLSNIVGGAGVEHGTFGGL